jgi:hypothetical protein
VVSAARAVSAKYRRRREGREALRAHLADQYLSRKAQAVEVVRDQGLGEPPECRKGPCLDGHREPAREECDLAEGVAGLERAERDLASVVAGLDRARGRR